MNLMRIRSQTEESIGYALSDTEFSGVLAYTKQKLKCNGKGEDYLPLLLETEIRDFAMRKAINSLWNIGKEDEPCAMFAT